MSIAIAVLSLLEAPYVAGVQQFSDKLLHSLGYLVLAATAVPAMADIPVRKGWRYLIAWSYGVLFGGVMELLQAFCTRTRSGDWLDWVADMTGALAGIACAYMVSLVIRRYDA